MTRVPPLDPGDMTEAQRLAHDEIAAGPRGAVRGPFAVLTRAPEIANHVQRLGAHLRWGGSLPANLRELAILAVARHWTGQYEWSAHAPIAHAAGVSQAVIDALAERRRPAFTDGEEALVYDFCDELQNAKTISQATFDRALHALGEVGLFELVALCGYYGLIAMVLNTFGVDPLPTDTPPLKP